MAVRKIRTLGDEVLRKTCRPVEKIDLRTKILVQDMFDTLDKANGAGLAAPQVGVLKRIFVVDVEDFRQEFINPEILITSGEVTEVEGCLSVPGKWGTVTRPEKVVVSALNLKGERFELTATGLLCKCICHENDHLDGIVYVDKVEEYVDLQQ